jgi:inner membrane protein involved in colicin E2 resistance
MYATRRVDWYSIGRAAGGADAAADATAPGSV